MSRGWLLRGRYGEWRRGVRKVVIARYDRRRLSVTTKSGKSFQSSFFFNKKTHTGTAGVSPIQKSNQKACHKKMHYRPFQVIGFSSVRRVVGSQWIFQSAVNTCALLLIALF